MTAKKDTLATTQTQSADPAELMRIAVENNQSVENIEKLMELQLRWQADQARIAYNVAMNLAQAEIRPVVRDAENTQTHSKYAKLETVDIAIGPIYTAHGFSVSFSEAGSPTDGWTRYEATCRHISGHSESTYIDFPLDDRGLAGKPNKTAVHAKVSSSSYARRTLLARIFNVVFVGEDDDGNAAGGIPVSLEQLAELRKWVKDTGTEEERICRFGGCDTLDAFPADKYAPAMDLLRRKAKNAKPKPGTVVPIATPADAEELPFFGEGEEGGEV